MTDSYNDFEAKNAAFHRVAQHAAAHIDVARADGASTKGGEELLADVQLLRPVRATNIRHGMIHVHSDQIECGIAYTTLGGVWAPCSKELNHTGGCGVGDLTAF